MNDDEKNARIEMTVEETSDIEGQSTVKLQRLWELRTPFGWCFEPGRHSSICSSMDQVRRERKEEPIQRCEPDCDCFVEESSEAEVAMVVVWCVEDDQ